MGEFVARSQRSRPVFQRLRSCIAMTLMATYS